ncbi:MAG TPA: biotin--[acetyl-CoA-carboxylase] ligase [Verrucomicrobiota bacterium]|mgnify:FL=1|nr:biotin--[acetyl-CoA-carboxylase] ligase [Verrucomicrobiota bacterium]
MTTDAKILKALRSASSSYVSGAELAASLQISRAAIWSRIEELRQLGYDIEASPHLGYRLKNSPDVLLGDDIISRIEKINIIGREINVFNQTTSTNDVIEKMAVDGVPEGIVVFAESQTKGRGRLGRMWHSTTGKGLWFSILLRPALHPKTAMQLTIAAATATRRSISRFTKNPAIIKWPNDIILNGKKVAGILNEISAEMDIIKYAILGIGVNANQEIEDLPEELRNVATSIKIQTGQTINRCELAASILAELDSEYNKIKEGKFNTIADEWTQFCETIGKQVTIRISDRIIQGRAESVDADGCLLVRKTHGHLERIVGGDVILEK